MRSKDLVGLVLVLLAGGLGRCVLGQATALGPAGVPPATVPATQASIPVVYDPRLSPDPVGPALLEEIAQEARMAMPDGHRIWYVHVRYHRATQEHWNVAVFYTPDAITKRLRKGKCLNLGSSLPQVRVLKAFGEPKDLLGDYVQVSLADRPFGEGLDTPTPVLWPFAAPQGFSDAEIVEIADFARTGPQEDGAGPDAGTLFDRFAADQPLLSIARNKDGTIEVTSGSRQGPLAGRGMVMTCVKKQGRWAVLSVGHWVS